MALWQYKGWSWMYSPSEKMWHPFPQGLGPKAGLSPLCLVAEGPPIPAYSVFLQVGEGHRRRLSASKQGVWASVSTQPDGQRGTDKWA